MSTVTLKLDHPDFPDDYEFGISELGRVKNHGTLEVSDEDLSRFETTMGMSVADAFVNNALITVSGQEPSQKQDGEGITVIGEEPPQQPQDQQAEQAQPSAPLDNSVVPPADGAGEQ